MSWRDPVFDYCERQSAAFWAEPFNALSNVAFLVVAGAALHLWRRRGDDLPVLALIALTAAVGVGSLIFHTVATRWAMLLDVIPIALFIYGYFLLTLRRCFAAGRAAATAITLAFAAFSVGVDQVAQGQLNGSIAYLPALAALIVFSVLLRVREEPMARAFAAAAGLFLVSLLLRTLDRAVCAAMPTGAHFLWHLLNAGVLFVLLRAAIRSGPRVG